MFTLIVLAIVTPIALDYLDSIFYANVGSKL